MNEKCNVEKFKNSQADSVCDWLFVAKQWVYWQNDQKLNEFGANSSFPSTTCSNKCTIWSGMKWIISFLLILIIAHFVLNMTIIIQIYNTDYKGKAFAQRKYTECTKKDKNVHI